MNPITDLDRPLGLVEVEAPRISRQSAHESGKVFSPKHQPPLPPGGIPVNSFKLEVESTQYYSTTVRINSMKNANVPIGNITRVLQAYSAVLRPTAPPRARSLIRDIAITTIISSKTQFMLRTKVKPI
jgi:hypothetical protein